MDFRGLSSMESLISFRLSEHFFTEGYEIFDSVLEDDYCEDLADGLRLAMLESCIKVNNDGIHINTQNGRELIDKFPNIWNLYCDVHTLMAREIPNLLMLNDLPVAVSVNWLRQHSGHSFRNHFDRNEFTAILYLTDCRSMPLSIYPKIRTDPALGDPTWLYSSEMGAPTVVYPRTGRLVCFHARTSLHGVLLDSEETAANDRVSLQFAYDTRRQGFGEQLYYGRPKSE